jgi:ATP-dependent DNA ligase
MANSSPPKAALATSTASPPTVAACRPGLTLLAFDLVWIDGQSLLDETYDARRSRLDDLDLPDAVARLPR